MKNKIQLEELKEEVDRLQNLYGSKNLNAVYGAGCIENPKVLFLFMNPTGKNISSNKDWDGLRACWLGTKNIWKLINSVELLNTALFSKTQSNNAWDNNFCLEIYNEISKNGLYITNLAKCTQDDARPLNNNIFRVYLKNTLDEIHKIDPKIIVSFGNQVSSILLSKNIKVSDYNLDDKEELIIGDKKFNVFPVYYPVGQGMRNINKAIERIKYILSL